VGLNYPDGKLRAWYVEKSKKQPKSESTLAGRGTATKNGDKLGV
jgi:hypothetical protein